MSSPFIVANSLFSGKKHNSDLPFLHRPVQIVLILAQIHCFDFFCPTHLGILLSSSPLLMCKNCVFLVTARSKPFPQEALPTPAGPGFHRNVWPLGSSGKYPCTLTMDCWECLLIDLLRSRNISDFFVTISLL